MVPDFVLYILIGFSTLFAGIVVAGLIAFAVLYVIDRRQTSHTVRRNFPVIGRLRYFFEHMGEFFRQYFFAQDREEMPFNRATRSYVYRAAKNVDSTGAFGSTRNLRDAGRILFGNAAFPVLEEDVEPVPEITFGPDCPQPYTTRSLLNISAMSYGSLSKVAIESLSRGAKEAGCWLNTGEGGLSPYHLAGDCDIVFQIGTAKYGVRGPGGMMSDDKLREAAARPQVKMFEIKLSQGAKPGKGGILPADKVDEEVAGIRGIIAGEASISPNRHPEISNVDELLDFIAHVRAMTGKPAGIKFVLGSAGFLDDLFSAIHERGEASAPDFITLDSADGGTGAAPISLFDYVGMPIRDSLPILVDKLFDARLKERIRVIASGKLVDPGEVAWALAAGADFANTARGFMFALGCIQAMQCNKNTCPTGITTHDPDLQRGLVPMDKAKRVANFHRNLIKEVEMIAHSCGVKHPRALRRRHVRVVGDSRSRDLTEHYPSHGG